MACKRIIALGASRRCWRSVGPWPQHWGRAQPIRQPATTVAPGPPMEVLPRRVLARRSRAAAGGYRGLRRLRPVPRALAVLRHCAERRLVGERRNRERRQRQRACHGERKRRVGRWLSSASQNNSNTATSSASNTADTTENANQTQTSSSGCQKGCGGSGQYQSGSQSASTSQDATSHATAHQNGVNANVPVIIAGGDVSGGSSSATQSNSNSADVAREQRCHDRSVRQPVPVEQLQLREGCGGSGQAQELDQSAKTDQSADRGRMPIRTVSAPTCRCRSLAAM